MKILHIVEGLQKASGVTTFVENIVAELRALGNEVDVITKEGLVEVTSRTKVKNKDDKNPLFDFDSRLRLSLHSYDLVHIHGLWVPWLHCWARAARKAGVKVVWSPHGMLTPWAMHYKWLKKWIVWHLYQKRDLQLADAIHVTVADEERDVRRVGLKNKVIVAPLGVRLPDLRVRASGGGGYTMLFVSRIHPKKGLENLIKAWRLLVTKLLFIGRVAPIKALPNLVEAATISDGWRLRIVGTDAKGYEAELKALADKEGVADRIDFAGPKYGEELEKEYLDADCFILPSFSENFGSVVVEAMAAGLPVITTKGTPWAELEERKCGWWVENDPETLARTIQAMMALSDEERRAMGARGRKLVEEKYQWPAIGRQMVREYERVVKN